MSDKCHTCITYCRRRLLRSVRRESFCWTVDPSIWGCRPPCRWGCCHSSPCRSCQMPCEGLKGRNKWQNIGWFFVSVGGTYLGVEVEGGGAGIWLPIVFHRGRSRLRYGYGFRNPMLMPFRFWLGAYLAWYIASSTRRFIYRCWSAARWNFQPIYAIVCLRAASLFKNRPSFKKTTSIPKDRLLEHVCTTMEGKNDN